jgi:serine/threonine protein kinase
MEVSPSRLRMGKQIGFGAHGEVFAATYWMENGSRNVAVKRLRISRMTADHRAQVEKEVEVMQNVVSVNVVEVLGVCMDPDAIDASGQRVGVCIVMKLYSASLADLLYRLPSGADAGADGGTASSSTSDEEVFARPQTHLHIKPGVGAATVWQTKMKLLHDIANGMCALHGFFPRPITHRDLKPANVFVADDGVAAVGDFGLAKAKHMSQSSAGSTGGTVGTLCYSAPETFDGRFELASDVWSYAMLAYEVVTGRTPFMALISPSTSSTLAQFVKAIVIDRARPSLEGLEADGCPPELLRLMQQCWLQSPEERPTFLQIRQQLAYLSSEMALGFFCSPADKECVLHLLPECRALLEEWGQVKDQGVPRTEHKRVQIHMMGDFAELKSLLEQAQHSDTPVRILHLSMHGVADEGCGLLFTNPVTFGHEIETVDGMALAQYIAGHARRLPTIGSEAPSRRALITDQGMVTESSGSIECVVITACSALNIARALIGHGLRYVVAWETDAEGSAALCFSVHFYNALRRRPMDFEHAFEEAVRELQDRGYSLTDPTNREEVHEDGSMLKNPELLAAGIPRLLIGRSAVKRTSGESA